MASFPQVVEGCAAVDMLEEVIAVGAVEVQKPCAGGPAVELLAAGTGWDMTVRGHHLLIAA